MVETSKRALEGEEAPVQPELPQTPASAYYASVTGTAERGWACHTSLSAEATEFEVQARESQAQRPLSEALASPAGLIPVHLPEAKLRQASESILHERQTGIGYQLLWKAGWRGGGLGAQEQGIAVPIPTWVQSGRQGIGSNLPQPQLRSPAPAAVRAAKLLPVRQGEAKEHVGSRKEAMQKSGRSAPKRNWEAVKVEEPLDKKVKRWRQVLQAEADMEAGKAIDQYIYRAFRDDSSLDTNPLLRRNNLSASNPLL